MGSFSPFIDKRSTSSVVKRGLRFSVIITVMAILAFSLGITARLNMPKSQGSLRDLDRITSLGELSAYHATGNMVDVSGRSDEDVRPLQTMLDALQQVRRYYVEPIEDPQEKDLTYGVLSKMLESLGDPQSRFLVPAQRELADDALKGKFHGIGAVLNVKKEKTSNGMESRLIVVAPLPGSPAAKAGLLPGDSIREKDGKWIISYDPISAAMGMATSVRNGQIAPSVWQKALESAKKKLDNGATIQKAADELTKVDTGQFKLTIVRAGVSKHIQVTITPGVTEVTAVEHRILDSSTGYIHINYFGRQTADMFASALAEMQKSKATKLILDLRNTPGGSVDSALRVAGWMTPGKTFAQLAKSQSARSTVYAPVPGKDSQEKSRNLADAEAIRKPIMILVNKGTSSAAEILAAELRDNGVAVLIGSNTYGEFLQHTMLTLGDGSAVTFTTGKYLTPKGLDLEQKGIRVDIAIAASSGSEDEQLKKAISVLKAKTGS
ncbi:MAG: S41 family peptidase [Armatimonadota bacterium]|nr:S41 family peptidase [Armatimonadota bacterium]